MPKSKKPRKKGKFGRKAKATAFFIKNSHNLEAVCDRIEKAEKDFESFTKGADKIRFLSGFSEEKLRTAQISDFFALEKFKTTMNIDDITKVSETLAIAVLLTDLLDLEPSNHKELNDVLQFGCFSCVTVLRLRVYGSGSIPDANLTPIHDAINAAQELITYAFEHNRDLLYKARRANKEACEGEVAIRRDQRVLGKYWATVREWAEKDLQRERDDPNSPFKIPTIKAPKEWAINPYA